MVRLNGMTTPAGDLRRGGIAAAAVLFLSGCASAAQVGGSPAGSPHSSSKVALAAPRTFGVGSPQQLLVLTPPRAGDKPAVPETQAQSEVDHPTIAPKLLRPVLFALTRATAPMIGWTGTGASPVFQSTLAWVGVFEVDPNAPHSCPGGPPASPQSMPAVQAHYYFAVLVDAGTNAQAMWNEDESGLLMRQCAAMWVGASSRG